MARRATFIRSLRESPPTQGKVAFFACPYEILPEGTETPPAAKLIPAMAQAFAQLGYDAGTMTPAEADVVKNAGAVMPASFAAIGPEPEVATVQVAGLTVGIVRFPAVPNPKEPVPAELAERTARAAASLRGKVKLVVGLSGWGMPDEEAFVNAHPGAVDVLLGSGPGNGAPGMTVGAGKTLWSRTFLKGKTVNRLDLFTLPENKDFVWTPKISYRTEVISLDDQFAADPEIQKLF